MTLIGRQAACAPGRAAVAALAFALTGCASAHHADLEPIVTDRPDFTESADVVPRGMMQLEGGHTFTRQGADRDNALGELLLRVGLAPRAELRLGLDSYHVDDAPGATTRGLGDALVGGKLSLRGAPSGWRPQVAILAATTLPTGDAVFGAHAMQPEAKLALAWELAPRVSLGTNWNAAWVDDAGSGYAELGTSASFGVEATSRVGTYLEYFNALPQRDGLGARHFVNGGATLRITPDFQLDARAGLGLVRVSGPNYFVGIGAARRW